MRNHLLILLCLTLSAFSQASSYVDAKRHFTFDFNELGWELSDKKANDRPAKEDVDKNMAERTLVAVQRKEADDKYHSRFSVVVDDLSSFKETGALLLSAYHRKTVGFLKNQRFDVLSTNSVKMPLIATPAFETIANQRDFGLTFRQVVLVRGKEAYILTATSRTKRFEAQEKELKALFDTFTFDSDVKKPEGK